MQTKDIIADVSISNLVISVNFNKKIDINKVLENLEDVEYEPSTFPGLIVRLGEITCLLFSSGRAVVPGLGRFYNQYIKEKKPSNKLDEKIIYEIVKEKVVKKLKEKGIDVPDEFEIEIDNIVIKADLVVDHIDLNKIYQMKDKLISEFKLDRIVYEPERFPGMRIGLGPDVGVTCLLFRSGKVVIAGSKDLKTVNKALEKLGKVLKRAGVL